jgi:hypothetical protein
MYCNAPLRGALRAATARERFCRYESEFRDRNQLRFFGGRAQKKWPGGQLKQPTSELLMSPRNFCLTGKMG